MGVEISLCLYIGRHSSPCEIFPDKLLMCFFNGKYAFINKKEKYAFINKKENT